MDLAPELTEFGWCPFARVTGEPCILCGGTRAVMSLLTGDVMAALRYNAVVVGVIIVSLVGVSASVLVGPVRRRVRAGTVATGWPPWRSASRGVVTVEVGLFALWWLWNLGRW